jgi:hypothetical protein
MTLAPEPAGAGSPLAVAVAASLEGIVVTQMLIVADITRSVAFTATYSARSSSASMPRPCCALLARHSLHRAGPADAPNVPSPLPIRYPNRR